MVSTPQSVHAKRETGFFSRNRAKTWSKCYTIQRLFTLVSHLGKATVDPDRDGLIQ